MITFYVLLYPKAIIRGQILILYFLERIGPCLLGSLVLWALLSEFLASPTSTRDGSGGAGRSSLASRLGLSACCQGTIQGPSK